MLHLVPGLSKTRLVLVPGWCFEPNNDTLVLTYNFYLLDRKSSPTCSVVQSLQITLGIGCFAMLANLMLLNCCYELVDSLAHGWVPSLCLTIPLRRSISHKERNGFLAKCNAGRSSTGRSIIRPRRLCAIWNQLKPTNEFFGCDVSQSNRVELMNPWGLGMSILPIHEATKNWVVLLM